MKGHGKKKKEKSKNAPIYINIDHQYVKGLRFDSKMSELFFEGRTVAPKINFNINIETKEYSKETYEVVLDIRIKSTDNEKEIFELALEYGAKVTIKGETSEAQLEEALKIHCPTLLFPFARQEIANVTMKAGAQPLMLTPIDFKRLYLRDKELTNQAKA